MLIFKDVAGFSFKGGGSDPTLTARVATLEDATGSITAAQSQSIGVINYGPITLDIPIDIGTTTGSVPTIINNVATLRFNHDDAAPAWRFIAAPLHGYVSGSNLTARALYALTGTDDGKVARWSLEWAFLGVGDTIPASYDVIETTDFNINGVGAKVWSSIAWTITGSTVDATKSALALRLTRLGTHGNSTNGGDWHVSKFEIQYNGYSIDPNAPVGG